MLAPGPSVADPALPSRCCPQCGAQHIRVLPHYSVEPWRLGQCAGCRFVYLQNVPAYQQLSDELAWEKTFIAETSRRRTSYPVINFIEMTTRWRLTPRRKEWRQRRLFLRLFKAGRVLDVGCWMGRSVPEPLIPFGIEISKDLARMADEHMRSRGGRAVCAPATEGILEFPDRYFSGVILSSILEHEANPKPLLRQVVRVMADDGKAYVRVPNFSSINRRVMGRKWCGFRHPEHVNYFTLASLRQMASDCGLRMTLIEPVLLPFNDSINAVFSRA